MATLTSDRNAGPPGGADSGGPASPSPSWLGQLKLAWQRYWYVWAMAAPVVVVLAVLVMFPLVRGVLLSFTDLTEANQREEICTQVLGGGLDCRPNPDRWQWVGLDNYVDIVAGARGRFWLQFVNTLVWTSACVVCHYLIGLGLALLLNRRLRGREVYRVLLIVPWAVPAFVSAFAWRFLFNERYGLINWFLGVLGADSVDWFSNRWSSLFAAIVTNVWLGVPFMMLALLGGLQSISADLYAAAQVDGANAWRQFWYVTLPGLRPVSFTVILLSTIWTFNMFPVIFLVTDGEPAGETEILVTGAFKAAFEGIRDYSLSATYGVLILSMLVVFATFYRRALVRYDGTG